jgi:type I restriction enzyme R subunit
MLVINPSQETQKLAFETYFREILEDVIDTNFDIYQKISDDIELGNILCQVMFNNFQKYLSDRRDQNIG